jgi:hypothetical protein
MARNLNVMITITQNHSMVGWSMLSGNFVITISKCDGCSVSRRSPGDMQTRNRDHVITEQVQGTWGLRQEGLDWDSRLGVAKGVPKRAEACVQSRLCMISNAWCTLMLLWGPMGQLVVSRPRTSVC